MSFPIPSFFKIRCGIIIIAFLLFFMFIGMLKQAFASTCTPIDHSVAGWGLQSVDYYASVAAVDAACQGDCGRFDCTDVGCGGWFGDVAFKGYYLRWLDNANTHKHIIFAFCASSCSDSDGDGTPDACETCPKQQGYKTNLLIASYCGNKITQCDGSSHTSYEWGFGPDSCTPVADQPCHVTADCKKDLNQDGIADGFESGVAGGVYDSQYPTADLNGNGIPDMKDCDYDYDHDGIPNCNDPCPNNAAASCTDPCAGITDGTCKDSDGDGIADSQDSCPQNPDTTCNDPAQADSDGDGKLDSEDPCPHNADTACVNPCAGITDGSCKDTDGDGIPDSQDKCPENPKTSCTDPNSSDDTQAKPYTSKAAPYTVDESASSEFKEALKARFQEFLDKLKTTSLFSIPSRLNNIVPSGNGETKITVDGGQTYGQHEVDFSGWTQGLAALNALVYMACYFIAIRIIVLKR